MHGEFKIPGGKLVVVDLSVVDGCLAGVQVSGDFFLEPPEALADIDAALEGRAAALDAGTLAALVRDALGPEVRTFGISPEGVATAVCRALGDKADQATDGSR